MAKNNKVVFKIYSPSQRMLLPPSLEELIPLSHPVRVVNEVIESVNLEILEKAYKGGGRSSYHPRMLLKILVYGYVNNVYSSRKTGSSYQREHTFYVAGRYATARS